MGYVDILAPVTNPDHPVAVSVLRPCVRAPTTLNFELVDVVVVPTGFGFGSGSGEDIARGFKRVCDDFPVFVHPALTFAFSIHWCRIADDDFLLGPQDVPCMLLCVGPCRLGFVQRVSLHMLAANPQSVAHAHWALRCDTGEAMQCMNALVSMSDTDHAVLYNVVALPELPAGRDHPAHTPRAAAQAC